MEWNKEKPLLKHWMNSIKAMVTFKEWMCWKMEVWDPEFIKIQEQLNIGEKWVEHLQNPKKIILEKKSLVHNETIGYVMPQKYSVDIDSQLDWEFAELLMMRGKFN